MFMQKTIPKNNRYYLVSLIVLAVVCILGLSMFLINHAKSIFYPHQKKISQEFSLGDYQGYEYKLIWQEIPVDDQSNTPDNPDAISNLQEKVALYKMLPTNEKTLIKSNALELRTGKFVMPCQNLDQNLYFPADFAEYQKICDQLQDNQRLIRRLWGSTSATQLLIVDLNNGEAPILPP